MRLFWVIIITTLFSSIAPGQELQQVGSFPATVANRVVVNGDFAYIIDDTIFVILDVIDKTSPSLKGSIVIPGRPGRFNIEGDYAYITADSGLQIVNISDRQNPIIVSHFTGEAPAKDVKVSGAHAYFLDYSHFRILDISNSVNPTELGNLHFSGTNEALAQSANYVYLIGWRVESDMLVSIDISNPANPVLANYVTENMFCSRLFIDGNDLYVVNQPYYFNIWDISTPGNFIYPPRHLALSGITNIFAGFGYAFATLGRNGLSVIDIATGDSCTELSRLTLPAYAADLYISGEYIYIADTDSLLIFRFIPASVSDPLSPPSVYSLFQSYPNPFNPSTTISFTLPSAQHVRLEIFDILGRRVRLLADQRFEAGEHMIVWDGNNQSGAEAPSGVYFYRFQGDHIDEARKMVLLR